MSGAYEHFNRHFVSLTPTIFGDALETTLLTAVEWHDAYVKDEV